MEKKKQKETKSACIKQKCAIMDLTARVQPAAQSHMAAANCTHQIKETERQERVKGNMTSILIINTHEADAATAVEVERKHYTVAQLIAELQKYDAQAEVVVKNLNTGKFGSVDFQGLTLEGVK